jgi:hypothetical protein
MFELRRVYQQTLFPTHSPEPTYISCVIAAHPSPTSHATAHAQFLQLSGTSKHTTDTTGGTLNRGSSSSSSSDDEQRRTGQRDGNLQKVEAPVVRERVHNKVEHIDQTQVS